MARGGRGKQTLLNPCGGAERTGATAGMCLSREGGAGGLRSGGPLPPRPNYPPTQNQKNFVSGKMKF